MAKCYIRCDVGVDQSLVEVLKTCLTEKGHEVVNDDIGDEEMLWHVEIDPDDVIVKQGGRPKGILSAPNNRVKMGDEFYLTRRHEDQKPIEEQIKELCEQLHKMFI